ncbi:hypothetical protein OBBRIDRAFT_795599 [Obba rivulosa]|uniref:Uncharacterized protein n=1 Tax=Obba rivulosa TaxID=1052685 RepID=A0A8E2DIC7_9APHY|nr:hypothetical protein OBBRIDRAFT_795599 [Obba rivulosa]
MSGSAATALQPIVATSSSRYDRSFTRPQQALRSIAIDNHRDALQYLPTGWTSHVHPEGATYYYHRTDIAVVTSVNMYIADNLRKIEHRIQVISELLAAKNLILPCNTELYLDFDEMADSCGYYFVDHGNREIFWLEPVSAHALLSTTAASSSHLRYMLEEQYWTHVENFPCHRPERLSLHVPELISILLHGQADHLTSASSTFPYEAKQCAELIQILNTLQYTRTGIDAYGVNSVARLWAAISHHRCCTFWGGNHVRLSRDQQMLETRPDRLTPIWPLLMHTLFNIPEYYAETIGRLFSENPVSEIHLREFVNECREEWKSFGITLSLTLLSLNTALLAHANILRTPTYIAIILCYLAFASAATLLLKHQGLASRDAATIEQNLRARVDGYGFLLYTVLLSLPKALFLWAVLVSSLQVQSWMGVPVRFYVPAALAAASALIWAISKAVPFVRERYELYGNGIPLWRVLTGVPQTEALRASV